MRAPASVDAARRSPGQALEPDTLATMASHFRHDFSQVRVHADPAAASAARDVGARAYTIAQDVFFGAGEYRPRSPLGAYRIAHELAHARQQAATTEGEVAMPTDDRGEDEARAAAVALVAGRSAPAITAGDPGQPVLQRSPLSERVTAQWQATQVKGRIFDLLRAARQPETSRDSDLRAVLTAMFPAGSDDLWLAEMLFLHGPEPLWPAAALDERGRRAQANNWAAESGDIAGSFAVAGSLPVQAFYFRGQTDRRAMIIAGVHGSEVSGVEVVEELLARLRRPGAPMPYYTLIVVPRLFPDRVAAELRRGRAPGSNSNQFRESGVRSGGTEIPTNRNFPSVPAGATPEAARHAAAAATTDAQSPAQPILAQNRILLGLIDRFQPERIASVHANRRASGMHRGGPGSGVFLDPAHPTRAATAADPRVEDGDADRDHPRTAEDRLTANMARLIVERGGRAGGNFVDTSRGTSWADRPVGQTRYDPSGTLHNTGESLGSLGPKLGMTTITVEVPWYEGSSSYTAGADRDRRLRELRAYAASLEEVFLGPGDAAASSP